MRKTGFVWLAAGLVVALVATGCRKKETAVTGTTEGMKPGAGEMTTEEVKPPSPVTPPIEQPPIAEQALGLGPLKDIYFDFDRYDIRPDQRPTLEEDGRWLLAHPGQSVLIEGHCDERGTEEYNLALGDRRANAAKDYLRAMGVEASRMNTISYGEAYPVDPRHNEEAWAKNRRAHFTLIPPKVGAAGNR